MDKPLTDFVKSVSIAPLPGRRRSSVMASTLVDLPEALGDREYSEIRGQLKDKGRREIKGMREMYVVNKI